MGRTIALTHNTWASGPDGDVPVVAEFGLPQGEDRSEWHETTDEEWDAYQAYWGDQE